LNDLETQFKVQAAELIAEINEHKSNLQSIFGFESSVVKGFDQNLEPNEFDYSIDQLDIYAQFLGEEEYSKMKDNYCRALTIMTELNQIEKDRVEMNAPI
jgi:hypothetical protein